MNAHTKLSGKGQVVIPKAIRERLAWREGDALDVIETPGGVLLKPSQTKRERITIEEFRRRHPPQPGPRYSIEEMDAAVLAEAARRYDAKVRGEE
jgi:AbrB family looped-hinge helix DNA binding protein